MRPVNLIPSDQQRRGVGGAGRSGGAVYGLLGVLALMLVGVVGHMVMSNDIKDRKAEIATLESSVTATEAQAAALVRYTEFAELEQKRIGTIRTLAESRFDWERVIADLSRVLPSNVWLTSFTGTVAPGVAVEGGTTVGNLRAAIQAPAVELVGCTTSQDNVARLMARLRGIEGVTRVSLNSSKKTENSVASGATDSASGSGSSGLGGDCRHDKATFPQFQLVLFFENTNVTPSTGDAPVAAAPANASGGASNQQQSGSQASQPAPSGSTSTTASQDGAK